MGRLIGSIHGDASDVVSILGLELVIHVDLTLPSHERHVLHHYVLHFSLLIHGDSSRLCSLDD